MILLPSNRSLIQVDEKHAIQWEDSLKAIEKQVWDRKVQIGKDKVCFEIFHKEVSYETHLKFLKNSDWQEGSENRTGINWLNIMGRTLLHWKIVRRLNGAKALHHKKPGRAGAEWAHLWCCRQWHYRKGSWAGKWQ